MHDRSSDPLTAVLQDLRLDGVAYGQCRMAAPWGVAFPAGREARFHFVAEGGAWLKLPSTDDLRLEAGDAVLLPRGHAHVLASAPEVPAVDLADLAHVPVGDDLHLVRAVGHPAPDGPASTMFCGTMRFNLDALHPLLSMMPPVMRAGDLARRDPTVPALMAAMSREARLDRVGSGGILARLADVFAATLIRAWVECACSESTGWVAAVQCPKVGKVLAAIHGAPEQAWTVPALADVMGASRSTFAEAFTRAVGESPAKYVARVRMFQARRWLAQDGVRVTVAAQRLGYDSEASFSRAFKRIVGLPPSAVRRERARAG